MAFQAQLATLLGNQAQNLSELKQSVIRPLLQLAVKAINDEFIEDGALEVISKNLNVSENLIDEWYSTVLVILKLHLRTPPLKLKTPEFKQSLQELKLPPESIQDIISVVTGSKRPDLIDNVRNKIEYTPRLLVCKWRIDIIISSSLMSKVLEPHILMEWTLSDGRFYVFELTLKRFHQLRHAIAKLLLEIQKIETYSVIKRVAQSI